MYSLPSRPEQNLTLTPTLTLTTTLTLTPKVEAREAEIAALRSRVGGADRELEAFHDRNAAMDNAIGDLRQRLDAAQVRFVRQTLTLTLPVILP